MLICGLLPEKWEDGIAIAVSMEQIEGAFCLGAQEGYSPEALIEGCYALYHAPKPPAEPEFDPVAYLAELEAAADEELQEEFDPVAYLAELEAAADEELQEELDAELLADELEGIPHPADLPEPEIAADPITEV